MNDTYSVGDKLYCESTGRYGEIVSVDQPAFYKYNTPVKYRVKWVVHKEFPVYKTTTEENLEKFERLVAFRKI